MKSRNFWLSKEVFLGLALMVVLVVPVYVFGGSKVIFVDKNAKGSEKGTYSQPYHTIERALKHAKEGTEVRVKKGTYEENITLPEDVKLVSDKEERDAVTIKGDSDKRAVVTMKDGSKLSHVTVKDGKDGILVKENAKAHIFNVLVKDNDRDGIHIESGKTDKRHRAFMEDVKAANNGKAGIYAEKRLIVLIDSDINGNRGDGIDLAAGTKAWFEDNHMSHNRGSGAKLILDGSEIWSKDNDFRSNGREGVEVNSYGQAGQIGLKKADLVDNGHYGIAKIARTAAGTKAFGGLLLQDGVRIESNGMGAQSPIVRGF